MPHSSDDEQDLRHKAKSASELQRLKLEKLLKHPDRPVSIPSPPKPYEPPPPPDFVRNVVGSSAGAGSGEYHIYRNLRKREYARQEYYAAELKKDKLDSEYKSRVDAKKRLEEERLAKNRAKRQKKKEKAKRQKKKGASVQESESSESSDSEEPPKTDSPPPSPSQYGPCEHPSDLNTNGQPH